MNPSDQIQADFEQRVEALANAAEHAEQLLDDVAAEIRWAAARDQEFTAE
jgi:hypothetical protein